MQGGATFLTVDASTIENKWLGESEKNAKAVFTLARYALLSLVCVSLSNCISSFPSPSFLPHRYDIFFYLLYLFLISFPLNLNSFLVSVSITQLNCRLISFQLLVTPLTPHPISKMLHNIF